MDAVYALWMPWDICQTVPYNCFGPSLVAMSWNYVSCNSWYEMDIVDVSCNHIPNCLHERLVLVAVVYIVAPTW